MLNCFVKDCFTVDYGIDGDRRIEQHYQLKTEKKRWNHRIFCLDCLYYKKCKGSEFPNCRAAKEFFETIKIRKVKNV